MAKLKALLYVFICMLFVVIGGSLTWANANEATFFPLLIPSIEIPLGLLVVIAFVIGSIFSMLMIGGYWWSVRKEIKRLRRQLKQTKIELDKLRVEDLSVQ